MYAVALTVPFIRLLLNVKPDTALSKLVAVAVPNEIDVPVTLEITLPFIVYADEETGVLNNTLAFIKLLPIVIGNAAEPVNCGIASG